MNKIKKLAGYLRNLRRSRLLLSLHNNGYLVELGWFKTLDTRVPTDAGNEYIPWCTYSYIEFIKTRLDSNMEVFEYGAGYSSIFYAKRVKNLVTVESDSGWMKTIQPLLPPNTQILFQQLDYNGQYCSVINKTDKQYDVIVVDGRDRVNCLQKCIRNLKEEGLIVLDDSERENYRPGIEFLEKNGFRRVDFWGIAPAYFHNKCTSVFYRNSI
jgi:hypothetical protein